MLAAIYTVAPETTRACRKVMTEPKSVGPGGLDGECCSGRQHVVLFAMVFYAFLFIIYLLRAREFSGLELNLRIVFSVQLIPFALDIEPSHWQRFWSSVSGIAYNHLLGL